MFELAEHLNKTVAEIESISEIEFFEWQAFFKLRNVRNEDRGGDL